MDPRVERDMMIKMIEEYHEKLKRNDEFHSPIEEELHSDLGILLGIVSDLRDEIKTLEEQKKRKLDMVVVEPEDIITIVRLRSRARENADGHEYEYRIRAFRNLNYLHSNDNKSLRRLFRGCTVHTSECSAGNFKTDLAIGFLRDSIKYNYDTIDMRGDEEF